LWAPQASAGNAIVVIVVVVVIGPFFQLHHQAASDILTNEWRCVLHSWKDMSCAKHQQLFDLLVELNRNKRHGMVYPHLFFFRNSSIGRPAMLTRLIQYRLPISSGILCPK